MKGERINPLDPAELALIRFPVYASPKIDGIRALAINDTLLTYALKPIPNVHVRETFKKYQGLEGELVLMDDMGAIRKTTSAIMTREGKPKVKFLVFDRFQPREKGFSFSARYHDVYNMIADYGGFSAGNVDRVEHDFLHNLEQLIEYERDQINLGYEGVVLRSPDGLYKWGRSTVKEGYMLKLTRRPNAEAKIVGFVERMKNNNEQKRDNHGKAKRSNHKAGKSGRGDLGAVVVVADKWFDEFEVGSGFSDELRKKIWKNRKAYLGKVIKFEYTEAGGYEVPRNPTFLTFRDKRDM